MFYIFVKINYISYQIVLRLLGVQDLERLRDQKKKASEAVTLSQTTPSKVQKKQRLGPGDQAKPVARNLFPEVHRAQTMLCYLELGNAYVSRIPSIYHIGP